MRPSTPEAAEVLWWTCQAGSSASTQRWRRPPRTSVMRSPSTRPSPWSSPCSCEVACFVLPWGLSRSRSRTVSWRSEEHTSELQSPCNLVCRLLLEKKKITILVLTLLDLPEWALEAPASSGSETYIGVFIV